MNTFLLVGLGGFAGSLSRFFLSSYLKDSLLHSFPTSTLIINTAGSLLLGALFAWPKFQEHNVLFFFLAIGFLGSFTTFSTFSYETFYLFKNFSPIMGLLNILLNNTLGLLGALSGYYAIRLYAF